MIFDEDGVPTHGEAVLHARPDGRVSAFYERFRSSDPEKLAWEFLRRSEKFQSDCADVRSGAIEAASVAEAWGLYTFKDCARSFNGGGRPRFLQTLVRYFPNFADKPLNKRITLRPGQVAFVLDARAVFSYRQTQAALQGRLWRRMARYVSEVGTGAPAKTKEIQLKGENHLECLQLLDLLHSGVAADDIKRLVPSIARRLPQSSLITTPGPSKLACAKDDPVDKAAANKRFSVLKRQAQQLANEGYIELAVIGAARRRAIKKAT